MSASAAYAPTSTSSQESASDASGTLATSTSGNSSPSAGAGATQLLSSGNITLNANEDPTVISGALDTVQNLISQALASSGGQNTTDTDTIQQETNSLQSLVQQVLQNDANIAAAGSGASTSTQTSVSNTTIYLILAGILAFFLFRKHA